MVKSPVQISFLVSFIFGILGILLFPYYTINPGVMIKDHMQLKNDCISCHTLGAGAQTEKCIKCHSLSTIGINSVGGTKKAPVNSKSNSLHQSIVNIQCYDCHTEHSGFSRENATLKFRHEVLSAELQMKCTNCHKSQKPNDDIHRALTINCSTCHSVEAWKPSHFEHELIGDLLDHCTKCHEKNKPRDVLHSSIGMATQCFQCHTTEKWKPSTFDHTMYFRFDKNHPSNCTDCHNTNKTFSTYTCYNCHEHQPSNIIKDHTKEGIKNLSNCVKCHRSGDKKKSGKKEFERIKKNENDN